MLFSIISPRICSIPSNISTLILWSASSPFTQLLRGRSKTKFHDWWRERIQQFTPEQFRILETFLDLVRQDEKLKSSSLLWKVRRSAFAVIGTDS